MQAEGTISGIADAVAGYDVMGIVQKGIIAGLVIGLLKLAFDK